LKILILQSILPISISKITFFGITLALLRSIKKNTTKNLTLLKEIGKLEQLFFNFA
tara:strand:+ start:2195 stop:2362 length:168 start_codon:yes stop_codon:yes gene_type:complete